MQLSKPILSNVKTNTHQNEQISDENCEVKHISGSLGDPYNNVLEMNDSISRNLMKSHQIPLIQYEDSRISERENINYLPIQLLESHENGLTTLNSIPNYRCLENSAQNSTTMYFDTHQDWQHSETAANLINLENPDAIYHYRHNNPQIYQNNQYNENFPQNQLYYNHNSVNMNISESNHMHASDLVVHNNFQMYPNHGPILPEYNNPLTSTSTHFNLCQNNCNFNNENNHIIENYSGQKNHKQHHLDCLNKSSIKDSHQNQNLNSHQILRNDVHNGKKKHKLNQMYQTILI